MASSELNLIGLRPVRTLSEQEGSSSSPLWLVSWTCSPINFVIGLLVLASRFASMFCRMA